jgi:hypothetical protein
VSDLVKRRSVLLVKGYAFVHHRDLAKVVVGHFRTNLSKSLTTASRLLPSVMVSQVRFHRAVNTCKSMPLGCECVPIQVSIDFNSLHWWFIRHKRAIALVLSCNLLVNLTRSLIHSSLRSPWTALTALTSQTFGNQVKPTSHRACCN